MIHTPKKVMMFAKQKSLIRLVFAISLLPLFVCQCNRHGESVAFLRLDSLVKEKQFFKLEDQFQKNKGEFDHSQQLYFNAFINNAFNRNAIAVKQVDSILGNYPGHFSDSTRAALLQIQEDSYFKLFQYAKAASVDSLLIHRYAHALDSADLSERKNKFLLTNALRTTRSQRIEKNRVADIKWNRNLIGLITIPVRHDTTIYSAIFDTRANISSVTQTFAQKLNLKMLPVTYDESSGITGIQFRTGLGIADSLFIGDILVRNVVFQVMPDSVLYLKPLKFSLDVILGFPVIAGLGEIHILKDGRMIIPQYQIKSDLHNLSLHGLDPVVLLKVGEDTLPFNFDLGASTSDLYYAFFRKYQSRVIREGYQKEIQLGGAGGIQKKTVWVLPSVSLSLGDKTVTIDSVSVFTKKIFPDEKLFGNIGNDFSSKFTDLVLNFDKMYIRGN